ncbi:hypothetical protein F5X96DRAFT_522384 [Biscogniauxia mediterranea]|nr:hypothetical protein F5X96DRAFT_522384 [Biscogniauxia mediterranea]
MNTPEEKKERFKYFLAHEEFDDEGDALDSSEEAHRQQSRSFETSFSSASLLIPPHLDNADEPIGAVSEIAASDTTPKPNDDSADGDGVEIIAVKPRAHKSKRRREPSGADILSHETTSQSAKQPTPRAPRSPSHSLKSKAQLSPDPLSEPPSKRKRGGALQMVPEAQRIFKGLSFYYIPPNDVNPARKMKITRAREHGATWVKDITDATHIIVDKGLNYADIKHILDSDPTWSQKILVNERFPADCLHRHILFNPDQGVYRVRDLSENTKSRTATECSASRDSDNSLKIKEIRHSALRRKSRALVETQEESQQGTAEISDAEDDLAKCIREVRGNYDLYDELGVVDDEITSDVDSPKYNTAQEKRATKNKDISGSKMTTDWQENFKCMKGGTKDAIDNCPNSQTIDTLQAMLDEHELLGNQWQVYAYRRAISVLKGHPKKIRTAAQARSLPGIDAIADKIEEIVSTGNLKQLENARDNQNRPVLQLFMNIYGVGVKQAHVWLAKGFRTLDDLKTKANLNKNQAIGVDYYDDLNTRIPRQEVEALGGYVKKAAAIIDPEVELIIGGSYRRGSDSSNDIDIIMTKPGTSATQDLAPFFTRLIDTLAVEGFLTAALASHSEKGSTWRGCCVLPKSAYPGPKENYRPTWRRIDLLLAPETQIGAALLYFTGNDLFNRSMRLLARKKGMNLNQKALYGVGISEARDEKRIFEILGVRWREPHERWC